MDEIEDYRQKGYSLIEAVATDEWGTLYRATYLPHRRQVLLRDFTGALSRDDGAGELLLAEIGAWARLDHPGVLQVLDWGFLDGRCYYAAMQPAGARLDDVLLEVGGVDNAGRIFQNMLAAIEAARRMGVLHLGLSTSNVWVEPSGSVQVAEFGLWYVAREFPAVGITGCQFPAPEQQQGGRASAATDVYSLGLIRIALGLGLEEARLASLCGSAPVGLGGEKHLIDRCLGRDPLERIRSAGELSDALEAITGSGTSSSGVCQFCVLKEERARGLLSGERHRPDREDAGRGRATTSIAGALPALLIAALIIMAVLVWWLALR
jgi:serine/threonine-protein kinase